MKAFDVFLLSRVGFNDRLSLIDVDGKKDGSDEDVDDGARHGYLFSRM